MSSYLSKLCLHYPTACRLLQPRILRETISQLGLRDFGCARRVPQPLKALPGHVVENWRTGSALPPVPIWGWPESGGQFELVQEERRGQVKPGHRVPAHPGPGAGGCGGRFPGMPPGRRHGLVAPLSRQTQTIMRPSIHANHGLYFLKRAKKRLRLGRNGGLLKVTHKSDSDGDGKMWRHADFARWADPASTCGASAFGTCVRAGGLVPEFPGSDRSGPRAAGWVQERWPGRDYLRRV